MKILFLILSVWTGGDGEDSYIFTKPTFTQQSSCVQYVRENFISLNIHVNEMYGGEGDLPNLFYCIRENDLKEKMSILDKGQQI